MIPNKWDNITVGTYSKLYPTFDTKDLEGVELVDNKINQLSIIKGISLDEAQNCNMKEVDRLSELLNAPLPTKIVKRFKLNGVNYRFNMDANQLNGGGYIGVMDSIKDDPIKNMHVTLFNLATPQKFSVKGWKDYEFKEHEVQERMDEFKQLPMCIAYPIALFFLTLLKNLIGDSGDFSSALMKRMSKILDETKADLIDGGGQ